MRQHTAHAAGNPAARQACVAHPLERAQRQLAALHVARDGAGRREQRHGHQLAAEEHAVFVFRLGGAVAVVALQECCCGDGVDAPYVAFARENLAVDPEMGEDSLPEEFTPGAPAVFIEIYDSLFALRKLETFERHQTDRHSSARERKHQSVPFEGNWLTVQKFRKFFCKSHNVKVGFLLSLTK